MLPDAAPTLRPPRSSAWARAARAAAVLLSAGLFVRVLWMANLGDVVRLLGDVGPLALVAVAPSGLSMLLDTAGWGAVLAGLEARVRLWSLVGVRLATEAVYLSFPGGPLIAEGLKPWFLERRFGVGVPESTASLAVKKALQIGTQGIYLLVSAALAGGWLVDVSRELGHEALLRPLVAGVGVLLVGLAALMLSVLVSGSVAARAWSLLARIPSARLRAWTVARERAFLDTDAHVRHVLRSHASGIVTGAGLLLAGWFVEAAESWLLLALLGIRLPFAAVLAFEPVVSFARSIAFFVPAGLGIQDAGYMAFLRNFGIPDATNRAAAFVLLKRFKEVFWIVTGWAVFVGLRRRRHGGSRLVSEAPAARPS